MKALIVIIGILPALVLLSACKQDHKRDEPNISPDYIAQVPEWSKQAIWYQIFVERFRNGDPSNDPTPYDIKGTYPDSVPKNWHITPWGQDWYKPDDYFSNSGLKKFNENLQLRRYGGDLQGVLDELDYLQNLGITAIYFNPLNDSPSLHKYDPRYWRHIDRNFGPHPEKDVEIISTENPVDPSTWKYTTADSLFLKVIKECHRRNIKLIMDYSWNHTGMDFWALKDVHKNGEKSEFKDWYNIKSFDDKSTPEDEFKYKGWYGIKYMPELKKDIIGQDTLFPFKGNLHSEQARNHIFNVAQRWLDPDKDGDVSDGVDGYRLDVAAEIPLGFWPEFRKKVREINPNAYLVGEIWWQAWPDKFMEPQPFLQGDIFDAIMNYRWYRCARWFFDDAPTPMSPSVFVDSLKRLAKGISYEHQEAMMNLTASHDAPRTSTSLYNKNLYKFNAKPYDDKNYKINKPDENTRAIQKILLMHQFTYVGAPHIWYGDEVGMWGADDPDCRKPMVWPDLTYEPETHNPLSTKKHFDEVHQDTLLLNFYKKLIKIRKENPSLSLGNIEFILADDTKNLLAYKRLYKTNEIIVAFNKSNINQEVNLKSEEVNYTDPFTRNIFNSKKGILTFTLPEKSGIILIKKENNQ